MTDAIELTAILLVAFTVVGACAFAMGWRLRNGRPGVREARLLDSAAHREADLLDARVALAAARADAAGLEGRLAEVTAERDRLAGAVPGLADAGGVPSAGRVSRERMERLFGEGSV